jgi:hypothetical protein
MVVFWLLGKAMKSEDKIRNKFPPSYTPNRLGAQDIALSRRCHRGGRGFKPRLGRESFYPLDGSIPSPATSFNF